MAAAILAASAASMAAPSQRVAGSGPGNTSQWATDQYPGFDGLDNLPVPEKKDRGWLWRWFGIGKPSCATAALQLEFAQKLATEEDYKGAAKAYDALVREWPASPEAPIAQFRLAYTLEANLQEYADAFEEYSYLLDFYPRSCPYAKIVAEQYKIVNLMHDTRRMFLGMSFTGNRQLRQGYEQVVRRLAYNLPRCKDTEGYLKAAVRKDPSHPDVEEMRGWLKELREYLAEDAWTRAKFYDSRQRTHHAAVASYEKFLSEYPDSSHADEARARIEVLKSAPGNEGGNK